MFCVCVFFSIGIWESYLDDKRITDLLGCYIVFIILSKKFTGNNNISVPPVSIVKL